VQRKSFMTDIVSKSDVGGRILITTNGLDRDKDRINPRGVDLTNYLKNPVVMWGHSYSSPADVVGRTTNLEVTDQGIYADFELRPAANDQDPQNIVRLLWEGGWIKAASIGFRPLEGYPNEVGGKDFSHWEMLEWSLIPIPANQDALRLAAKSLDASDEKAHQEPDNEDEEASHKDGEVQAEAQTEGEVKEAAQPEAGHDSPAADDNQPTPEQELRLAAILADFINSIRPYLSSSGV